MNAHRYARAPRPKRKARLTACPVCYTARGPTDKCAYCGHNINLTVIEGVATDFLRWQTSHPTQYAWLKDHADSTRFAQSLLSSFIIHGTPTPKQQEALDRITRGVA